MGIGIGIGIDKGGGSYVTTPTLPDVVGLKLQLMGDAGVISDVNGVSQWDDQSPEGNDVVQSVNAKKPIDTDLKAGLPVITFDGVDDVLKLDSASMTAVGHPHSTFMVYQYVSVGGAGQIISDGSTATTRIAFFKNTADPGDFRWFSVFVLASGMDADTNWHVHTALAKTLDSQYRIDGTQKATNTANTPYNYDGIILGSQFDETLFTAVRIAEYLVYSGKKSVAEAVVIEDYLTSKWTL